MSKPSRALNLNRRILIVTEGFTYGGLETHIRGEIKELAACDVQAHLVVGQAFQEDFIPHETSSVTSGLPMKIDATIEELIDSVEVLRALIRRERITIVHGHPFMSFLPAYLAAKLEGILYVVTLHGPESINGSYGTLYNYLNALILQHSEGVFAVSGELAEMAMPHVSAGSLRVQPNAVLIPKIREIADTVKIKKWLVAARLDEAKTKGVKQFLETICDTSDSTIAIAGDGPERVGLEKWCEEKGYSGKVSFLGLLNDLQSIMGNYDAVAGMGRVVLEGIACGKRTCIVGYDGVKGMINEVELFLEASISNFSGRGMPDITKVELKDQIATFNTAKFRQVTEEVFQNYNQQKTWHQFVQYISSLTYSQDQDDVLLDIYRWLQSHASTSQEQWANSEVTRDAIRLVLASHKYADTTAAHMFRLVDGKESQNNSLVNFSELDSQIAQIRQDVQITHRSILTDLISTQNELENKTDSFREDTQHTPSQELVDSLNCSVEDLEEEKVRLQTRLEEGRETITAQQRELSDLAEKSRLRRYTVADNIARLLRPLVPIRNRAQRFTGRLTEGRKRRAEQSRIESVKQLIEETKLFNPKYYLDNNVDVRESGMDPTYHYLKFGYAEQRRPSIGFDPVYYLQRYPDVVVAGIEPLLHYYKWGKKEKRQPTNDAHTECTASYIEYNQNWSFARNKLAHDKADAKQGDILRIKRMVGHFVSKEVPIIVVPLSYPLTMTQRPDHFFRYFSAEGNPILLLSYDKEEPYIKQHKPGVYITNMIGAALKYLQAENTTLLITYPYFSYFISQLQPTHIVYDVLDELITFSGDTKGLHEEHLKLLEQADIVTYSSRLLHSRNQQFAKGNQYLVENGVWVDDFKKDTIAKNHKIQSLRKNKKERIIGYYGVVGNLLDWDMLEKITAIDTVRLVFIGPKDDFINSESQNANAKREKVLSHERVTYLDRVPYEDLPAYSYEFDAAIIPFILNDITHPVSPLKLFEYMATGHTIFATPTKTLSEYNKYIEVDTAEKLVKKIEIWSKNQAIPKVTTQRYSTVLKRVDWARQLAPVATRLKNLPTEKIGRGNYVDIININFYDKKGRVLYKGGAERYVFDLATKLAEMGHHPRILQNATKHFEKDYRGIPIVGMQTGEDTIRGISRFYNNACQRADLIIASPLDLACELRGLNVIGVNHGIHWDNCLRSLERTDPTEFNEIFDALKNVSVGVCVDTNFINWTRTYDYLLGHKLKYIPNYYDKTVFKPSKKDFDGELTFMYPRRLYAARGIYTTIDAFTRILKKYQGVKLLLVGQTDDKKVKKAVDTIIEQYPGRVSIEEYDMEDMHKAYRKSQVVVIPTLYSEGTSLSCLEAMATNNAIIATNIGGLPNLIVDSYNGLLIDPNDYALEDAVDTLINDRLKVQEMAKNGLKFAEVFEKKQWDKKWQKILEEELGE